MTATDRQCFEAEVRKRFDSVVELCAELIRIPSENPPGDTGGIAALIETKLSANPAIALKRVIAREPAVNLIAKLSGRRPGRRRVINGHLDTFPVGNSAGWSVDPFGGVVREGRLYGRGAADMKAGLAVAVSTALLLAEHRDAFTGELAVVLVGDEETGGEWGTRYLLANEPDALGDAMISGDAGSPDVLRFGEKGQLWIEVEARGKATTVRTCTSARTRSRASWGHSDGSSSCGTSPARSRTESARRSSRRGRVRNSSLGRARQTRCRRSR